MAEGAGKTRRPPPTYSRDSRKREIVLFYFRGPPASLKKSFGTLAGLPQGRKRAPALSRTSRERKNESGCSRGPPANENG